MTPVDFYAWRKSYGLTQESAAEQFRVSGTTIESWESGQTAIPSAVDDLCEIWGRRFRQLDPGYGPLTLVYFDGPVAGATDHHRMAHREPCISNAAALARVAVLSETQLLFEPQILERREPDGPEDILWSLGEIDDVLAEKDTEAPTVPNLLRAIALEVSKSPVSPRLGQNLLTEEEKASRTAKLEAEVEKLTQIAAREATGDISAGEIGSILGEIRKLGPRPRDSYVSGVFQALAAPKQAALARRGLGLPSALGIVRWISWRKRELADG
jgi:hypothetical protein